MDGSDSSSGFSLVETLVATTLVIVAVVGLAQLAAGAATANGRARAATIATLLASSKIEDLLAVPWSEQLAAATSSDTLERSVPGYYDVLDAAGRPTPGAGDAGAERAAGMFLRRWSVRALEENPGNAVVLQVAVTTTSAGQPRLIAQRQTVRARRYWWTPAP